MDTKNSFTGTVIDDILDEVAIERYRQLEKWGQQDHPSHSPVGSMIAEWRSKAAYWKQVNDARHAQGVDSWDGILVEEVYEALAEADEAKVREELIQVAAVAVAWIEAIDRRLPPEANEDALQDALPEAA